jgi:PAS domain S-box-containing protein
VTRESRHSRLLIALLTVCFTGGAGALGWQYVRQRAAVEEATLRELAAIGDIETAQIENWRDERLADARILMKLPEMGAAERLISGTPRPDDRRQVESIMESYKAEYGYRDVSLVDNDGQTFRRLDGAHPEARIIQKQRVELARQAAAGPSLSDINLDRTGERIMTLTIPIGTVGALILEIDPRTFLDPYLRTWRSSTRTGETFLIRREPDTIVYLTELRHAENHSFRRRITTGLSIPPEQSAPTTLIFRGVDYRGAQVIARARHVAGSRWFLVAKIDRDEIAAPLRRLSLELMVAIGLIGIAFLAGIGWIWRGHQLRMRDEADERLRSFANDTPALLWVISADKRSIFVNEGLNQFLGASARASESISDWKRFVHPADLDRIDHGLREALERRTRYSGEARVRRADGQYRWVIGQAVPRMAPTGEFHGFAGALLDITDRKEVEQQLQEANVELADKLAEITAKEAEIHALSARLINAHEEERRRLSRELHDDLSQQIAGLSIGIGGLKRAAPKEDAKLHGQFDSMHQRLIDVSESVRRMSHELHPSLLRLSGLPAALRSHCREFEQLTGIRVALRVDGDFASVNPDIRLTVFRIVQEALRNVAKHAQVEDAEVELSHHNDVVQLTVRDWGIGLSSRDPAKPGLGLLSIRERAGLLGGSVEFESAPGRGTAVRVRIPDSTRASVPGPEALGRT